jgi:hypothetical protein
VQLLTALNTGFVNQNRILLQLRLAVSSGGRSQHCPQSLSDHRPEQVRQTDDGNSKEEVRPKVERTVQQVLAVIEAGVWQCAHRGHPNRSEIVCKIPTPCKTPICANNRSLPAPVVRFEGVNCTKPIHGSIVCWPFRQGF